MQHTQPASVDRKRPQEQQPLSGEEIKRSKILPMPTFGTNLNYVQPKPVQPKPTTSDSIQPKPVQQQERTRCNCIAVIDNITAMLDIFRFKTISEFNIKCISRFLFRNAFTNFICSQCFQVVHFYPVKILETSNQLNFSFHTLPAQHREEILNGTKTPFYYQYEFNEIIDCNHFKDYMAIPNIKFVVNGYIRSALKRVKSDNSIGFCYIIKQDSETGKLIHFGDPIQQQQKTETVQVSRGVIKSKC